MSAATPEQLDEVAASLVKAYLRAGSDCTIVRSHGTGGDVRVISLPRSALLTSEFLHHAADVLFDGPVVSREMREKP